MNASALPRGACDCHCHVFGPAARFPYAEPRSYTPDDAPLEAYLALIGRLGFGRGVPRLDPRACNPAGDPRRQSGTALRLPASLARAGVRPLPAYIRIERRVVEEAPP